MSAREAWRMSEYRAGWWDGRRTRPRRSSLGFALRHVRHVATAGYALGYVVGAMVPGAARWPR